MKKAERVFFIKGLWRGLSGTLNLFPSSELTAPVKINVKPLRPVSGSAVDAMRSDWEQTGHDLDSAIMKYGYKTSAARSAA